MILRAIGFRTWAEGGDKHSHGALFHGSFLFNVRAIPCIPVPSLAAVRDGNSVAGITTGILPLDKHPRKTGSYLPPPRPTESVFA